MAGNLHISPTKNSPEFIFNTGGVIKMKGRGLLSNNVEVSGQIWTWIDAYVKNPAKTTSVNIRFDYLNSFSTLVLVNILKKLTRINMQSSKLLIKWYYEEDDDDMMERGEYISSIINFPIRFIVIKKSAESKSP